MTWALVSSSTAAGQGSAGTQTTSPGINTAGADVLIVGIVGFGASHAVSDTFSNTGWTLIHDYKGTNNNEAAIYYCASPTVGANHKVTVTGAYTAIFFQAWSGSLTATPYDGNQNGGTSGSGAATTQATGSVTPANANSLIITVGQTYNTTSSVNASFTIASGQSQTGGGGVGAGGAMAYLQQSGGPTAVSPTWTFGSSQGTAAAIACFAPAGGGGGTAYTLSGSAGSYAITGVNATLTLARKLSGSAGSYAISGQAATLTVGRKLAGAAGSYVVSGQSATMTVARKLSGSAGSYVINGQSAVLTYHAGNTPIYYTLSGAAGAYSITGQPATLFYHSGAQIVTIKAGSWIRYRTF